MEKFLLKNETAARLYEKVKGLPIIDYHCHLSASEIYYDKKAENLTGLWLNGDHYKWRLMRGFGVDERLITGNAPDYEKFEAYIRALEYAAGNPLYLWSKMELAFYFGITEEINLENAPVIWKKSKEVIEKTGFSPIYAINSSNVEALATTEEIFCDLKYHKLLKDDTRLKTKILPGFRGDRAYNIYQNFKENTDALSAVTGIYIKSIADYKNALKKQLDSFLDAGCVSCDFAFDGFEYTETDEARMNALFLSAYNGKPSCGDEYISHMLKFLMEECYKRGFAVQLHIGAMRNNNSKMFALLGADSGYDTISAKPYHNGLKKLLDAVESGTGLGRTVIFHLNPSYNAEIAALCGCYQGGEKGRVQPGAAWWFNDTKNGMKNHLKCYSDMLNLGTFVGMLTDSRSFISYPRHDYFRRVLCSFIGKLSESGEYTSNFSTLETLAKDISYYNAKNYFRIA